MIHSFNIIVILNQKATSHLTFNHQKVHLRTYSTNLLYHSLALHKKRHVKTHKSPHIYYVVHFHKVVTPLQIVLFLYYPKRVELTTIPSCVLSCKPFSP